MDINCYLAMTAAEYFSADTLPNKVAWMACHFASYGTGISNKPYSLPPGSMLILNDRIPPRNHDPIQISEEMNHLINKYGCSSVLLDFQEHNNNELKSIAAYLSENLTVPVGIAEEYAKDLNCCVFLNAPALQKDLSETIKVWSGRKLWLEIAPEAEEYIITEAGSKVTPSECCECDDTWHKDKSLHCSYSYQLTGDHAHLNIQRSFEDLKELMEEAGTIGVEQFVGLYQQLNKHLQ